MPFFITGCWHLTGRRPSPASQLVAVFPVAGERGPLCTSGARSVSTSCLCGSREARGRERIVPGQLRDCQDRNDSAGRTSHLRIIGNERREVKCLGIR